MKIIIHTHSSATNLDQILSVSSLDYHPLSFSVCHDHHPEHPCCKSTGHCRKTGMTKKYLNNVSFRRISLYIKKKKIYLTLTTQKKENPAINPQKFILFFMEKHITFAVSIQLELGNFFFTFTTFPG